MKKICRGPPCELRNEEMLAKLGMHYHLQKWGFLPHKHDSTTLCNDHISSAENLIEECQHTHS